MRIRYYLKTGKANPERLEFVRDPETGLAIPKPPRPPSAVFALDKNGFRNPEVPVEKPAGLFRIAFLGESIVFCGQVTRLEKTWPYLTTALLRPHLGKVDFVNASVPGFTASKVQRILEYKVAPLKPDLILLLQGFNDLNTASRTWALRRDSAAGKNRPPSAPKRLWSRLRTHSVLCDYAAKNATVLKRQWQQRRAEEEAPGKAGAGSAHSETPAPLPEEIRAPYAASLDSLLRAAREIAPRVVVLPLVTKARKSQDLETRLANASTLLYSNPHLGLNAFLSAVEEYNALAKRAAEKAGALALAYDFPAEDSLYFDSSHLTEAGCRHLAEILAAELLKSGVLSTHETGAASSRFSAP